MSKQNTSASKKALNFLGNNAVPIMFIIIVAICIPLSGFSPVFLVNEIITRMGRNIFLILSLLIPIMAGMGLNFGMTLGAIGILMYQQGFGFIQLYMAPFNMALPAVSAILIGGASVNKATITNVVIGTILFQGIVTMTPTVMNNMIHMDISEVLRMVVSNGMILYALTRKTEVTR